MTIRPSLIDCDDDKITLDDGSPRICAICGVTANLAEDSPQKRVYECPVGPRGGCGARETITKTEKAGSVVSRLESRLISTVQVGHNPRGRP